MLSLYFVVLSLMTSLVPAEDPILRHGALATALVMEVPEEDLPLMIAISYRESSLDNRAVGDAGRSLCAFQILGGSQELLDDPRACVRKAYAMLLHSRSLDPAHPVAAYARGSGYRSRTAQRISNDRVALANRLAKSAVWLYH
jgi:hypothetical protein